MMLLNQEDTGTSDNWNHSNPQHIAGFKPFLMAQIRAAKEMALFQSDYGHGCTASDVDVRWNMCIGQVWIRLPQAHATKIIAQVCDKAGEGWDSVVRRYSKRNDAHIRGPNFVYSISSEPTMYGRPCVDISIFCSAGKIPNPDYDPQLAKEEEE